MGEMDKSKELYSREGDNSSRFEGKTVPWEHTILCILRHDTRGTDSVFIVDLNATTFVLKEILQISQQISKKYFWK